MVVIESVFITGCDRGIGLELVRQFAESDSPPKVIIASCLDPDNAKELIELKTNSKKSAIHIIKLDVTNDDEIKDAAIKASEILGDDGLTLLINNAGVYGFYPFPGTPSSTYINHLHVNSVAPLIIADNLLPLLKKAANKKPDGDLSTGKAAVISIGGQLGCYTHVESNLYLKIDPYRLSKNALNHVTAILQRNLRNHEILAVAICPDWIQTDMGTKRADLTLDDGVSRIMNTIHALNDNHAGRLVNNRAEILDW